MKPLRLAVLGCAAVVLSSSADVSAQGGADTVTRPASSTGPCASVAAAFDQVTVDLEAAYAGLRRENLDAQTAAAIPTRLADVAAKITAVDARIASMDGQLASLRSTCFGRVAAIGTCTTTIKTTEANREAAVLERAALVEKRDAIMQELRAFKAEHERLTKDLATAEQSLMAQKSKALLQCAKIQQQAEAITRFCGGKMLGEASKSTVVLVGGTPAGAQAIASVDRNLGLVRTALPALAGDATVDKAGAVSAALDQAAGKGLLIDGGSAFLQTAGSRTERGGRSIVSSMLDVVPRLVLVHLDGPVGARERTAAAARGWRVAPDGEDGVRLAACTR